jgi:hypothetical protein
MVQHPHIEEEAEHVEEPQATGMKDEQTLPPDTFAATTRWCFQGEGVKDVMVRQLAQQQTEQWRLTLIQKLTK